MPAPLKKSNIRSDFMNVKEYLNDKIREANETAPPHYGGDSPKVKKLKPGIDNNLSPKSNWNK